MSPDELLLALHDAGITLAPHGDRLHVDAPKGVVSIAMAAALKEHKALLLAIFRTLDDRARDADWEVVRAWLIDDTVKTLTPTMLAAAKRIHLPVGADEWPEAYARRFRAALRVRGLLRAFDHPTITPSALKGA
ncbi:MAG: hypothetical protein M3008_11135 [Chloroflexota bacterium]|nr:hypothetical protein [Chloroflexota bacterium]